jgi:hypothetical protein
MFLILVGHKPDFIIVDVKGKFFVSKSCERSVCP